MPKWSPRYLIILCFHFLLFSTPLIFTWVNEELFEFNKMLLTYAVTAVITGLWSTEMVLQKKIVLRRTPFDYVVLFFLISQMLSTIFSMHPRTSVLGYYTRFHGGLLSTISYLILMYAAITFVTKKQLKLLLITTFVSASLVSLYGISEHFGQSPSCLLINSQLELASGTSTPSLLGSLVSNPESYFNVDCWIQDVQSRVFATFGQPNWLAAYTAMLLPVAASLFLAASQKSKKIIANWHQAGFGLVVILLTVVTLFTRSRSGFLGLGLAAVVFAIGAALSWYKSKKERTTPKISTLAPPAAVLGAILVSLMIWFGTPFSPSLEQKIATPTSGTAPSAVDQPAPAPALNRLEVGGTDSGDIRKVVWTGAIRVWQRYPLFGSGLETFGYSYYQDRPLEHNLLSEWDFLYNKAHNEFLNFLATTGLVGLLAYLAFLGSIYWYGTQVLLDDDVPFQDKLLVTGWLSGVAGLTVTNFFGFSTVMVSILLFLSPAVIMISLKDKTASSQKRQYQQLVKQLDATQIGGLLLSGVVTLYLLFAVWSQWQADYLFYKAQEYEKQGAYAEAIPLFTAAVRKSPQEAIYYQHLAIAYAQLSIDAAVAGEAEAAGQAVTAAERLMATALNFNSAHLNLYKAQARMYIILSQLDQTFLTQADEALQEAVKRSPTDAKLRYNRALVAFDQGRNDEATALLDQAIEMKPNYDAARMHLGDYLAENDQPEAAIDQYLYVLENIAPDNQEARDKIASVSAKFRLENPLKP